MQAIFDSPMQARDPAEPLGQQLRAQEMISGFGGRFACSVTRANYLADGRQARPPMTFL